MTGITPRQICMFIPPCILISNILHTPDDALRVRVNDSMLLLLFPLCSVHALHCNKNTHALHCAHMHMAYQKPVFFYTYFRFIIALCMSNSYAGYLIFTMYKYALQIVYV